MKNVFAQSMTNVKKEASFESVKDYHKSMRSGKRQKF